ncbi:MAG: MBL fold metallo-hydrolase [Salinivirgaceae bacterium]|nr:MBL fold metallo-hydrolase [Salinivirgaceae bacterium]
MKLTYIFHSGFALETNHCVLIFDYWTDPANVVPQLINVNKPMYVFASHFHEDHFSKNIFEWRKLKTDITYVLSKDILKHKRAQQTDAKVWMVKGDVWEDENLKVTATGSNDCGVSWVININGKSIFHAGDLCNWYARFLADEIPAESVYSKMLGKNVNPVIEEKRFLGELKDLRKVTQSFDLAMFPVDGRIGNGYTRGARQFIERFKVKMFVPMHFEASGFESAWRMEPFCQESEIAFWKIKEVGETVDI